MSNISKKQSAIYAKDLSKVYRLYDDIRDQAIDVMGLNRLFFWRKFQSRAFPALSGINVNINHGERVGIIGQNGAGKTTFLKLITGAIAKTDGTLEINGEIQALMQVGLGFHPEFTGRQNISASLLYSGLNLEEKKIAEQDVIEFCELGQFLDQPLKTYSLGMQSRLQFACATAIKPDILVVDEILGAGDAYFSMKSSARMEKLTKSGCTLLLVSHSMAQVLQFCERVVWIKDGKVEEDGAALPVVKAYEQWMHEKSLDAGLLKKGDKKRAALTGGEASGSEEVNIAGEEEATTAKDIIEKETAKKSVKAKIDDSSRWKTEGSELLIHSIETLDASGQPSNLFEPDSDMNIEVQIEAQKTGEFPVAVAINIYSASGESVIWARSDDFEIKAKKGDFFSKTISFNPIMLNEGKYLISTALFEKIIPHNKAAALRYDLISRGVEFAVTDAHDGNNSLFRHPYKWSKAKQIIDANK